MKIVVSIVCNTYNQRNYIRDALDGFLMQITEFPYEILIHDDASTDGTTEIVKEYAERYPKIIKLIIQNENQYSKGKAISESFQFPRAQGKYIAFCEGDDYWTDPRKLQKQVEAMEKYPQIDICAHRMMTMHENLKTGFVPKQKKNTIFSPAEVITGGGGFEATASLIFRRTLLDDHYKFIKMMSVDYVWQIHGALRGGMLYLGDCMGVYRQRARGSWTVRAEKDANAPIEAWTKIRNVLETLNHETSGLYDEEITAQMAMMSLNIMVRRGEVKRILSYEGRRLLETQSLKQKIMIVAFAIRRKVLNMWHCKVKMKR